MDALERLSNWQLQCRGRTVTLEKPPGYGVHDWSLKLRNVDLKPSDLSNESDDWVETEWIEGVHHACVVGIDGEIGRNNQYSRAPNFVHGIKEEDLEILIHKVIDKAEELCL